MSQAALTAVTASPGSVHLSAASLVEIAGLQAAGRIELTVTAARRRSREYNLVELAIDGEVTERLSRLPLLHRDPFDRLLVAHAGAIGATILTPDPKIAAYDVPVIW